MKTWQQFIEDKSGVKLKSGPWEPIDVKCPQCTLGMIEENTEMVFASLPPKRKYRCDRVDCSFKEIA